MSRDSEPNTESEAIFSGHPHISIITVYRNNNWQRIPSLGIVEGDIIALMAGDATPGRAYELLPEENNGNGNGNGTHGNGNFRDGNNGSIGNNGNRNNGNIGNGNNGNGNGNNGSGNGTMMNNHNSNSLDNCDININNNNNNNNNHHSHLTTHSNSHNDIYNKNNNFNINSNSNQNCNRSNNYNLFRGRGRYGNDNNNDKTNNINNYDNYDNSRLNNENILEQNDRTTDASWSQRQSSKPLNIDPKSVENENENNFNSNSTINPIFMARNNLYRNSKMLEKGTKIHLRLRYPDKNLERERDHETDRDRDRDRDRERNKRLSTSDITSVLSRENRIGKTGKKDSRTYESTYRSKPNITGKVRIWSHLSVYSIYFGFFLCSGIYPPLLSPPLSFFIEKVFFCLIRTRIFGIQTIFHSLIIIQFLLCYFHVFLHYPFLHFLSNLSLQPLSLPIYLTLLYLSIGSSSILRETSISLLKFP